MIPNPWSLSKGCKFSRRCRGKLEPGMVYCERHRVMLFRGMIDKLKRQAARRKDGQV